MIFKLLRPRDGLRQRFSSFCDLGMASDNDFQAFATSGFSRAISSLRYEIFLVKVKNMLLCVTIFITDSGEEEAHLAHLLLQESISPIYCCMRWPISPIYCCMRWPISPIYCCIRWPISPIYCCMRWPISPIYCCMRGYDRISTKLDSPNH